MSEAPEQDSPEPDSTVSELTAAIWVAAAVAAPNQQVSLPPEVVKAMAEQMKASGWQRTGEVDTESVQDAIIPPFVKQAMREQAEPVPVEPDHHAIQETPLIRKAPKQPARIAKKYLGVVTSS